MSRLCVQAVVVVHSAHSVRKNRVQYPKGITTAVLDERLRYCVHFAFRTRHEETSFYELRWMPVAC